MEKIVEKKTYINTVESTHQTLQPPTSSVGKYDTSAASGGKLIKVVAVSFGLLCVFQVSINISFRLGSFAKGISVCEAEVALLLKSINNLTVEGNGLQKSNSYLLNLTNQLERSNNNLMGDKLQLQSSYNNLTSKNQQLRIIFENMMREKEQIKTMYNSLVAEKGLLQRILESMTNERNDLQRKLDASHAQNVHFENQRNLAEQHFQQGWISFGSSFYYISTETKSWADSRLDCLHRGADLIVIENQAEQNFIKAIFKTVWIGLTDAENESVWKWVDGTLLGNTRYWCHEEPNNSKNEDCVEADATLCWNDLKCAFKKLYICEKKGA